MGRAVRSAARHKRSVAAVLAVCAAAAVVGPLSTAATATAAGRISLTNDQVVALSNKLTVGVAKEGTTAQRVVAAAVAGAPRATEAAAEVQRAGAPAAPATAAAGPATPSLTQTNNVETPRGLSLTGTIPGSHDWYRIDTAGQVSRVGTHGLPQWTRTERSFVADWGMKGSLPWYQVPPHLDMFAGYDPVSAGSLSSNSTFAVGDFGGGSGGQDLAVVYSLGFTNGFPFTLPDSTLTRGASFVTVLSGLDGHTLWHKVYPGLVTSLVPAAGGLIVADETGPAWRLNPVAEQGDSRSALYLLRFTATGHTAAATTVWSYSRQVPWARWTAVTPTAYGIAAAWTDTPLGLGSPRPADGHVILLDAATGALKFDTRTPGYPRFLVDDAVRHRIVAGEENDPTDSVFWQVTAYDPASGARSVLVTRTNAFPTTLSVGDPNPTNPAFYASEVGVDSNGYATGSTALALGPSGAVVWGRALPPSFDGDIPIVGGLILPPMHHESIVVTTQDPRPDTEAVPDGPEGTQILALDSRTGAIHWSHQGAVGTGLVPAQFGDAVLSVSADDNAYAYQTVTGAVQDVWPQLGDAYSGVQVDVNGDGVKDLVVGGESRGVFAIDGHPTPDGTAHILWTATVQGAVHQIQVVNGGSQVLVAATGGWDLVNVTTGTVATAHDIPGAYTWSATPVRTAAGLEIVVPTHDLTAYTADGQVRWTYRPAGSVVKFSDVATDADGRVIAEYGTAYGDASNTYRAVALDAATGAPVWTAAADPSVTGADFKAAVYTNPDLPLGGGHAAAFAWQQRNSDTTLIEIRDTRTGAVLATHVSYGSFTHIGFGAAAGVGLIQVHIATVTRLQPDGTTWSDTFTFPDNYGGGVATSGDGSPVVVTASKGLQVYAPSVFTPDADNYPENYGRAPALDDSDQFTVDGSQLIGFTQDMRLWDLDWQFNGGGFYAPDYQIHGISVNQIGVAPSASPAPTRSGHTPDASVTGGHPDGLVVGDPISGTGWGDGKAHNHAVIAPDQAGAPAIRGYRPDQIQHNLALTGNGQGQTVAIVDAFHHPNITADLNTFAQQYGLPHTCDSVPAGTACFDFTVQQMPGMQPGGFAWDAEVALDVEWVHAVAPMAHIVLVESASDIDADMYRAVDAAAALHPAAVSMSWGGNGEFSEQDFYNGHCLLTESVCVESSGDSGNPAGYGATAPDVLSIGGTSLRLDAAGNTLGQTAWNGSGGGLSYFEARPAFQNGFNTAAFRGAPDVSAVADPRTGVAVYVTIADSPGRWLQIGGTSLAAPIWAAILAVTDAERATADKPHLAAADGSVFTAIYGLGTALTDVTTGSNGPCPAAVCTARAGYDTVTGLGAPAPGVDAALAAK